MACGSRWVDGQLRAPDGPRSEIAEVAEVAGGWGSRKTDSWTWCCETDSCCMQAGTDAGTDAGAVVGPAGSKRVGAAA